MSCLGKSASSPGSMGECLYLLNITQLFLHSAPVDDRTGPKGSIFEGNGATIKSVHRREVHSLKIWSSIWGIPIKIPNQTVRMGR